jgi:uncharacterized protein
MSVGSWSRSMRSDMPDNRKPEDILRPYLLLTYLAVLVNAIGYLQEVKYHGWFTVVFVAATYVVYSAAYLAPVAALWWLLDRLLRWKRAGGVLGRIHVSPTTVLCIFAVLTTAIVQVLLFADRFIFHLYGFHINGFVLNLVFTRGGIESLGADAATGQTFTLIVLGLISVQIVLFMIVLLVHRIRHTFRVVARRRTVIVGTAAVIILGVFGQVTYGMSVARGYMPIVLASDVFPLYAPITFTALAEKLGVKVTRTPSLNVDVSSVHLAYPAQPIECEPPAKPYNIILLIAESLRWDMLDPKIMPATWALAQKSLWCRHHYSGANCTRMAMFSMFYGLYGSYWFQFVTERRGPLLMDLLINQDYQIDLYTSAGFSYPEFDKTLFSRVPPKYLHERVCLPQWRCDRQQIGAMLDAIDQRDPSRPFMTFMFFESTHANYHFPPETVVVRPFAESVNYATMDVAKDAGLMKNRYINASNHVDTQVQRVLEFLEQRSLLDSTIVLVAGDHGEEFMEKGRWGHNSTFSEEQTLAPFVLWVPGRPAKRIDRMTSHLDLPATLLPMLGVKNPPEDYSVGLDLYGDAARGFTILTDWNRIAYVDEDHKVVFKVKGYGFSRPVVMTRDDVEVSDPTAFFTEHKAEIVEMLRSLREFGYRK